jgi:hypothetical protein
MIRFLDAENLKIITKSDYVIFEMPNDLQPKKKRFIV